jgi:hypothetical protein
MTGPKQRFGSRISRPLEHREDEHTARIRDFHAGIDASTGYLREDSAAIDRCTVITTVRSSEHVRSAGGSQRRTPEQPKRWRTQPDPPAAPARILNAWLPRDLFLTALRDQLTSLLLDRQTRCLSRRPALEAAGTS